MVMPEPSRGIEPQLGPMPDVPPVGVTTIKEARYYLDACEAWMDVDKVDLLPEEDGGLGDVAGLTREQVETQYPGTTRETTCSWALYGWPAESQLNFEKMVERLAGATEQYRGYSDFLWNQLMSRYRAIQEFNQRTKGK